MRVSTNYTTDNSADEPRLAAQVEQIKQQGFAVIPNALSSAELAELREAFDRDRQSQPDRWELRGSSRDDDDPYGVGEVGRWQTEPLDRAPEFDTCIWHPSTFVLLERVMGSTLRFHGLSAMSRDPVDEPVPPERRAPHTADVHGSHVQMWHREGGGSFAPEHPFCLQMCMVLYYLDDCNASSHCFSVVPESLEAKKSLRVRMRGEQAAVDEPFIERMWRNRPRSMLSDEIDDGVGRPDGVDILGPAGTAIVTNACNIHAGTVRQSPRPRRSVILWWGHGPQNYTARAVSRPGSLQQRHNNGHDMFVPDRLISHPTYSWLFSPKPLTAEEAWVSKGVVPAAPKL